MPTYGMILWCIAYSRDILPLSYRFIAWTIGGTTVLTMLIPTLMILIMRKMGMVSSIHLSKKEERRWPYIFTLICYGVWCYYLGVSLRMPWEVVKIGLGAMLALGIVMTVNRWWKISAHATGIGGLIGGVIHYYWHYHTMQSVWPMVILFAIAWLIAWARLYLDEHSDSQVVAGLLTGMACMGM